MAASICRWCYGPSSSTDAATWTYRVWFPHQTGPIFLPTVELLVFGLYMRPSPNCRAASLGAWFA